MADNVAITEGSGTTIAADEIAGVKYQRVKIALGADGAYDGDLDAGQATTANSLPVVLPSDYQQPILPVNATPAVASVSAINADMVAAMSVANYRHGSLQVGGFGSATVQVQFSNDAGVTWVAALVININTGLVTTSITAAGIYTFAIPAAAQMRIRTTAYASGPITGALLLSSLPATPAHLYGMTSGGQLIIRPATQGNGLNDASAIGESWVNTNGSSLWQIVVGTLYNGSNYDRPRNVNALTLLASAARTADLSSSDQVNYNWRGLAIFLNVSAQSGGSVKVTLQYKDAISGNYFTVWSATAAVTATGQYAYLLYPGALDAASWTEKVQFALAMRTWRLTTTTANGSSITYSVSADMLP